MNKVANFTLAMILVILFAFPFLLISFLIRYGSPGPAIHWSKRVGRNNILFSMPKFRTMRLGTPEVATHLLNNPDQFITPIGRFLRKTSLDELPQLWSILTGEMAFVGPRPALHNQNDLVDLRKNYEIHHLTPGITGWSQVKGRDHLGIPQKVELEHYYLENRSLGLDIKILWLTFLVVTGGKGISH
jgi:O-antigen biosynthesis protein WbqP